MSIIFAPLVSDPSSSPQYQSEKRAPLSPDTVKRFADLGFSIQIESGIGLLSGFPDAVYETAGAKVISNRAEALQIADIIIYVKKPQLTDTDLMKKGAIVIGHLSPFFEQSLIETLAKKHITAVSVEMLPRISRSQKMDALSSMANLAGYVMVIEAAKYLNRIFPMLMTPAGTISPARVFVIGVGVAGLQAIATAKRLGANVLAFDTREVVAEQVKSLGAKFLQIDLGETGQTKDGYAAELTAEQIALQKEGQKKAIANSDVVITTAQVFGRKPPLLVTKDMIAGMKPGSVVVDMAAEDGGNVEGSVPGKIEMIHDVHVVGIGSWPSQVSMDATNLYANNLYYLVETFYKKEGDLLSVNFEDEIHQGCVITHEGELKNQMIIKHYKQGKD